MTSSEHTDALPAQTHPTVNFRVMPFTGPGRAPAARGTIPHFLGRYRVLGEVARGGMGVVLRAYDADLDRELAVKLLAPDISPESEGGRRFAQEARLVSRLRHPGIIPVYEADSLPDGRPYFAMPFVPGETLGARLGRRRPDDHDPDRWLGAFERVCTAIAHAHAEGVVHRDLKPGNVMLGADGHVLVMDWGVAVAAGPAADPAAGYWVFGTPAYMPPEQARGHGPADPRGDVFGLGAILCEILTGQPPHLGPDVPTVTRQAAAGDLSEAAARLRDCGADPALVELARRCLSPDPADRPADAGAVARAVRDYRSARRPRRGRGRRERLVQMLMAGLAMAASALVGAAAASECQARAAGGFESPPAAVGVTPAGTLPPPRR